MPSYAVWILGDQLLSDHPALAAAEAAVGRGRLRVVLIESAARLGQQPYQRKKLVLLLSAMHHYAAELAAAGYQVDYRRAPDFAGGLRDHLAAHPAERLLTMAAAEEPARRLQGQLSPALGLPVDVLPNTQFLLGRHNPFPRAAPERTVIMATFYRAMRRHFGVLLDPRGEPEGGQWSYDAENRRPLPRGLEPPAPPSFPPDAITRAVMGEVALMPGAVGSVEGFDLAVTRADAEAAAARFFAERLADFGPYEDAMARRSELLYHSGLSPYLNLGLLTPLELVRAAEAAYRAGRAPLNSVEGFIRQILGWREYMYWQYWRHLPALREQNAWGAARPLPGWFWSGETDMACLRHVISGALARGYNHHIERLMVLCNFCLLAGISPQAVNDWFMAAYVDAYDWVMLPNVLGMGLNADGGRIATKPYIASANYINSMGDYCAGCRYRPRQRTGPDACPFNLLYWNFLIAHEPTLRANPRLGPAVLGLGRIGPDERATIRREAAALLEELCAA